MRGNKREQLLNLFTGEITAIGLQRLAATHGITTSEDYCRRVLKSTNRLKRVGPGRTTKHDAIYSLVRSSSPRPTARQIAEQFGIPLNTAKKILTAATPPKERRGYGKTPLCEFAKQLTEPVAAKWFSDTYSCSIVQAYNVLKRYKKLISGHKSGASIKPKRPTRPRAKRLTQSPPDAPHVATPPTTITRKIETRTIDTIYKNWIKKNG